jgi:hypothetical protein
MKDIMMADSYDRNIWYNRFYLYEKYMWMDEGCASCDLELKADPKKIYRLPNARYMPV